MQLEKEKLTIKEGFQNLQNQFDNLKLKYDSEIEDK